MSDLQGELDKLRQTLETLNNFIAYPHSSKQMQQDMLGLLCREALRIAGNLHAVPVDPADAWPMAVPADALTAAQATGSVLFHTTSAVIWFKENDQFYFMADSVFEALGIENSRKALNEIPKEFLSTDGNGILENGIIYLRDHYSFSITMEKPNAFCQWIKEDVMPMLLGGND